MTYAIEFADSFDPKSLRSIPLHIQDEIESMVNAKLTNEPIAFGKPLRFILRGCRRLRVGDYRVIYFIRKSTVIILDIGHRSTIYPDR